MPQRGVADERELIHKLDALGFAALRAPASGASTSLDRPDIVAGRRGLHVVLEVKTTSGSTLYLKKGDLERLTRFAERFGANPYVAVKFKRRGLGWLLFEPSFLTRTKKGFKVNLKDAKRVGKPLEFLVTREILDF